VPHRTSQRGTVLAACRRGLLAPSRRTRFACRAASASGIRARQVFLRILLPGSWLLASTSAASVSPQAGTSPVLARPAGETAMPGKHRPNSAVRAARGITIDSGFWTLLRLRWIWVDQAARSAQPVIGWLGPHAAGRSHADPLFTARPLWCAAATWNHAESQGDQPSRVRRPAAAFPRWCCPSSPLLVLSRPRMAVSDQGGWGRSRA